MERKKEKKKEKKNKRKKGAAEQVSSSLAEPEKTAPGLLSPFPALPLADQGQLCLYHTT